MGADEPARVRIEDLTAEAIAAFLLPPSDFDAPSADPSKERKEKLRETMLRFHPDKFEGRVMKRVREKDRERVKEAVEKAKAGAKREADEGRVPLDEADKGRRGRERMTETKRMTRMGNSRMGTPRSSQPPPKKRGADNTSEKLQLSARKKKRTYPASSRHGMDHGLVWPCLFLDPLFT